MTRCKRCGKDTAAPELFYIPGTMDAVEVCPACDAYLGKDDRACERFALLIRAQDKLAEKGKMPKIEKKKNKNDWRS